MYRTISDFTLDWKYESAATLKVLHALTDKSLHQKVSPDGRSLVGSTGSVKIKH